MDIMISISAIFMVITFVLLPMTLIMPNTRKNLSAHLVAFFSCNITFVISVCTIVLFKFYNPYFIAAVITVLVLDIADAFYVLIKCLPKKQSS